MAEQDILFFLSGDAQEAIDALSALIDVVGQLDEALRALASSLTILDDVTAALAAMGSEEEGVIAVSDAIAVLGDEIDVTANVAPVLEEALAAVSQVAAEAAIASVELADALSGEVVAADTASKAVQGEVESLIELSPVIDQSIGFITVFTESMLTLGFTLEESLNALVQYADGMLSAADMADVMSAAMDGMTGSVEITTQFMMDFVEAMQKVGVTEEESLALLIDYEAGLLTAADMADIMSNATTKVADAIQLTIDKMGPATEAQSLMAIAQANVNSVMVDFTEGAIAASEAASGLAGAVVEEAVDMELLQAVVEQLYVAMGEADATIMGVTNTLADLANSGVESEMALQALEQVAGVLGVDFDTLLPQIDAMMVALDLVAPSADMVAASLAQGALAAGNFGAIVSANAAATANAAASLSSLATATDTVTASSSAKNTVLKEQTAATEGDAYMILVLLQFLLQAVGGFVQMGTAAQDSIAHLSGLADQSLAGAAGMGKLNGVISQLEANAIKFGITLTDASDGLYFIMSGGFNTADAMTVLSASMHMASGTGASMTSVSSALVSILNSFGLKADQAGKIADKMAESMVKGRMPAQDYANAIGNLSSEAARSGFSFDEATSALATMTQMNQKTRQDAQNLAQMFNILGLRADDTAKAAKKLGISFDETHYKTLDLEGRLKYLAQVAGGDNTVAFGKLMLTQTGARAAFDLLSDSGNRLGGILNAVENSTGALDIAFGESEKTITASSNHMNAALSVLAYQLVVLATPIVKAFLDDVTQALAFLTSHMNVLLPVVIALAVIIGGLLVTALGLMVGMMWGVIETSLAISAPLALLAAGIYLAVTGIQNLVSHSPGLTKVFDTLGKDLDKVGKFLSGVFAGGVKEAGDKLKDLGTWIEVNVVPKVKTIVENLAKLADKLIKDIPAAVMAAQAQIKPFADYLMNTVVPNVGKVVLAILNFCVKLSADIPGAINNAISIMNTLLPVIGGLAAAYAAFTVAPFVIAMWEGISACLVFLFTVAGPLIIALGTIALEAIIAAAPFIAIGLAVGILVAAVILAVQHVPILQAVFRGVWKAILDVWNILAAQLVPIFQQLQSTVTSILIPAFQQLMSAWQPLLPYLEAIGVAIIAVVVVAFGLLVGVIVGVVSAIAYFVTGLVLIISGIIGFFAGLSALVMNFLHWIVALFTGNKSEQERLWKEMGKNVQAIWNSFLTILLGIATATIGTLWGLFSGFVETIISFFTHIYNEIVGHSIWPDMFNEMTKILTSWVDVVGSAIASFVSGVIRFFTDLGAKAKIAWNIMVAAITYIVQVWVADIVSKVVTFVAGFITKFNDLKDKAVAAMQTIWTNIVNGVKTGISNVVSNITTFVSTLGQKFLDAAAAAVGWGSGLMSSLASGITAGAANVVGAASNVAQQIAGLLHHSTPDFGPLAGDDKWMPDFGDMLASGLNDQVNKVGVAASRMAMSVQMAAPSASDVARYSAPATSTAQTDPATLNVLQAILAELQQQRQSGSGRMTIGHTIPSTSLGTTQQTMSGGNSDANQYQRMNTMAGIAYENSIRGSSGLGV